VLKKSTIEDLTEDAEDLYSKSNMHLFLTKVVQEALKNASARSIAGIMNSLRQSSRLLKKRVGNQVSLFEAQKDLAKITTIRNSLQTVKDTMSALKDRASQIYVEMLLVQNTEWARESAHMRKCIEDYIEGNPTYWHIPFYRPKPNKYFGDKKIVGSTKEEVLEQVQPALDDLRAHVTDALRATLNHFANNTYIQTLNELVNNFNSEIVAKARTAVLGFKQFNIHFAFPKRFELPSDIKLQLGNIALPSSHVTTTKEIKTAWWWFFTLIPWEEEHTSTISSFIL
jgi:molybdopterin converting factor small subunit